MRIRKQQSGFTVVELVAVVVIIAAIVAVGWWVYSQRNGNDKVADTRPTSSTQSPVANNVSKAPQINSTSDLDKALQTLNQNDPATANAADSSQLSSQASTF